MKIYKISILFLLVLCFLLFACNPDNTDLPESEDYHKEAVSDNEGARAAGKFLYLVIERIVEKDNPDNGKAGDYYPKVTIGNETRTHNYTNNTRDISPYWIFSEPITGTGNIDVALEIYDHDPNNADDICDINPVRGQNGLYMIYNPNNGTFTERFSPITGVEGRINFSEGSGDSPRLYIWFRFYRASSNYYPAPKTHPSNHKYLGNYPKNRENSLSKNIQGVTHDESNWFITKTSEVWKIPVTYDLKQVNSLDSANGLRRNREKIDGINHYGDISYYNGHVFIPGYKSGSSDPSYILVFRASDLGYVGKQEIRFTALQEDETEEYPQLGHVAIGSNGLLYVSHKETSFENPIIVYKIDNIALQNGEVKLNYWSYIQLRDELAEYMRINHLQGSVVSPDNKYLYLVSGYCDDEYPHDGINVFSIYDGMRVARSTQGYGNFNYQFKPGGTYQEEPEGITIWDLDDGRAPGITGYLHVLMLDNDGSVLDDDFYFKHYTDGTLLYNSIIII
ncbi:MAG: hypothetical protein JXJ04_25120 [Spirochaetales bacterium]|nr:hypothetical protein [Spirochaetales bacterium]